MQEAHKANLPTTATMVFGGIEKPHHIIEHLEIIRSAQDESKGFYSFIPWVMQFENTRLQKEYPELTVPCDAVTYLKVLSLCRLYLDNIPNLQASWVTMGPKIGQTALHFGANDIGSIMIEENVVSAAGTHHTMTKPHIIELIQEAGFIPLQRDTYYNYLPR